MKYENKPEHLFPMDYGNVTIVRHGTQPQGPVAVSCLFSNAQ